MRICLLVDHAKLAVWQQNALRTLGGGHHLLILSCTNTRVPRRRFAHAAYYLLNLAAIRNAQTRSVSLDPGPQAAVEQTDFQALYAGAWQQLPAEVIDRIALFRPDVILKFGMGLLRVPEGLPPILSYHHGDPHKFRGRPAGFYEIFHGERMMGQIVQVLSNKLDAGRIAAACESKVLPYSYRGTLEMAYSRSPLLLAPAIARALSASVDPTPPQGPVYTLPDNFQVARFLLMSMRAMLARLLYGLFLEKRWKVSLAPGASPAELASDSFPSPDAWRTFEVDSRFTFYADPFFSRGNVIAEGMNARTGKGQLLILRDPPVVLTDGRHHFSYPATIAGEDDELIVPEISDWSTPRLFRIEGDSLIDCGSLQIETRLLDPTLLKVDGGFLLFGNNADEGADVLRLWSAPALGGPFVEHPDSPVLISAKGGRMAGGFIRQDGQLFRLGQDGSGAYGDGIVVFRVETASVHRYREDAIGALRFDDVSGPHTLNFSESEAVFDWYVDRLSPFAGVRRLLARIL
jgi:hypothetical protein